MSCCNIQVFEARDLPLQLVHFMWTYFCPVDNPFQVVKWCLTFFCYYKLFSLVSWLSGESQMIKYSKEWKIKIINSLHKVCFYFNAHYCIIVCNNNLIKVRFGSKNPHWRELYTILLFYWRFLQSTCYVTLIGVKWLVGPWNWRCLE